MHILITQDGLLRFVAEFSGNLMILIMMAAALFISAASFFQVFRLLDGFGTWLWTVACSFVGNGTNDHERRVLCIILVNWAVHAANCIFHLASALGSGCCTAPAFISSACLLLNNTLYIYTIHMANKRREGNYDWGGFPFFFNRRTSEPNTPSMMGATNIGSYPDGNMDDESIRGNYSSERGTNSVQSNASIGEISPQQPGSAAAEIDPSPHYELKSPVAVSQLVEKLSDCIKDMDSALDRMFDMMDKRWKLADSAPGPTESSELLGHEVDIYTDLEKCKERMQHILSMKEGIFVVDAEAQTEPTVS